MKVKMVSSITVKIVTTSNPPSVRESACQMKYARMPLLSDRLNMAFRV